MKSRHLIGWTLSTWPSLFRDTDWDADIDRSKTVIRLVLPVYTWFLDRPISARDKFMYIYIVCVRFWSSMRKNTIVTDMEGNIRIDRLPLNHGTEHEIWYLPRLRLGQYHFHWSVPWPLGVLYILILPSISVTIIEVSNCSVLSCSERNKTI